MQEVLSSKITKEGARLRYDIGGSSTILDWLRKYDNLIQDKVLTQPNQLWVADITYVKSNNTVYFLYLITDAYSQKIVGWNLSLDLKAASAKAALEMAIKDNKNKLAGLVHHSDRGVQYCSANYVRVLEKNGVSISMTKPASLQENAIVERVNGISKNEWLYDLDVKTLKEASRKTKQVVGIYNEYRPHNTLKNQTPSQIHDLGFKMHKAERVIGKSYRHKKRVAKMDDSLKSENAIGQTIIPQAVAPQQSYPPLGRCKAKLVKLNGVETKKCQLESGRDILLFARNQNRKLNSR